MQPAVPPAPARRLRAAPGAPAADAPGPPPARHHGNMTQSSRAQAHDQQHGDRSDDVTGRRARNGRTTDSGDRLAEAFGNPQPSVGSIAAHRPYAVAGPTASPGLEPDLDADLGPYPYGHDVYDDDGYGHDGYGHDGYGSRPAREPGQGDAGDDSQGDGPLPQGRFLDRERSWLAFNERVLELAEDPATPLLERANFLAIFASNLDEFFMVRVAGLKRRIATGVATRSASGLQPREVLELIWTRSRELMARHAACYQQDVAPALAEEGIHLIRWNELTDKEQGRLFTLFRQQIFPVLTPLAVDPAHPFPYISGLSLNLAVVVRNPVSGHDHFARVKVPPILSRFLEASPQRYVPLEDVIAAHLEELFPGMEVLAHHMFRVTRNEDLEVEEDDAENLLQALEKELMRRRFGPPVRLEVEETIDPYVLDLLVRELKISDAEVYPLPGPLDLTALFRIAALDRPELKYPKFVAGTHRDLAEVESASAPDIFAALRERDVLLHHPYDSFSTSVQAFLEQAAADPDVLAIKQTLYRTSGEDSPIVDALIDAAESGKQVLVLVEIKARFDEQANIKWARKLEEAGCHVVYGLVGLKTHCKLSLVVRQEGDTLRRYSHVGTGNYHPKTARLYEDLGLLTADPQVGADLSDLFNRLSGYSRRETYRRLLVAPRSLRDGLVARIANEVAHHRAGRPASIRIKVNSMVDETVIDALYRAARAGVPVDVWVRGICALRPGVPGLSENIRVRSVLGRFLEHSRVFAFGNGGEPEVWLGSADMMHRNLDRRIETLVRVTDPAHRASLSRLLEAGMSDTTASWHLGPDGGWTRHATDGDGQPLRNVQEMLIDARRRRRGSATP
ncbi:RNA degradosome polyphosphate kinase [Streptomyces roseoverticillatus]|uniref:RNA degradosome polyphosphate kinase n=1 Tax=Streptomyces roseoverticillatus TaxID=66429 RepID=UPI001FE04DAA|nr:RNA degradosome polyphosphate kinase [Streptomyces roseoverticillatus]